MNRETPEGFSMIYIRDNGVSGYEVRIATYNALTGSKIHEEIHTEIKDLRLDIRGKIMRIGNKEIYLVSEEPIQGISRKAGELYITRKAGID
ncbi:MAG: hypothetical protein QXE01_02075 [Sulfolobales archaeon]